MDTMPLISVLCYSIPEAYLIFTFGLVILGCQVNLGKVLFTAVVFAFVTWFVRRLPAPFGFHVLIHCIVVWGLFVRALKLNVKNALLATFLSTGMLLVLESTILYAIQRVLNLTVEEIWQDKVIRTLIGWPHLLVWTVITVCCKKFHINLDGFKEYSSDAGEDM